MSERIVANSPSDLVLCWASLTLAGGLGKNALSACKDLLLWQLSALEPFTILIWIYIGIPTGGAVTGMYTGKGCGNLTPSSALEFLPAPPLYYCLRGLC